MFWYVVSFVFRAHQNTAHLVEILSDATHKTSNKICSLKTLLVITSDKPLNECNLFYEPILKLSSVNDLPCLGFVNCPKKVNKKQIYVDFLRGNDRV